MELSVREEMNRPIVMNAEPIISIPNTFPIITLQSAFASTVSATPSITRDRRQRAKIQSEERNLEMTTEGTLTGAVSSAWSVLFFLSSAKDLIVISGITKSTIKNILWNTPDIFVVPV